MLSTIRSPKCGSSLLLVGHRLFQSQANSISTLTVQFELNKKTNNNNNNKNRIWLFSSLNYTINSYNNNSIINQYSTFFSYYKTNYNNNNSNNNSKSNLNNLKRDSFLSSRKSMTTKTASSSAHPGPNLLNPNKTKRLMRLIYSKVHPDLFTNHFQAQVKKLKYHNLIRLASFLFV